MTASHDEFCGLLEAHEGILHKVANAYCRDRDDRQDLVQEIIINLWRAFDRYDRALRFSTWMYRIAMNVAISQYRAARSRGPHPVSLDEVDDVVAVGRTDADDDVRLLYDLVRELDELNRALAILYLDGHSYDEIGAILGLTPTNVSTRINRLKERLRIRYEGKRQ